jgi:hypothetical protein
MTPVEHPAVRQSAAGTGEGMEPFPSRLMRAPAWELAAGERDSRLSPAAAKAVDAGLLRSLPRCAAACGETAWSLPGRCAVVGQGAGLVPALSRSW